VSPNGLTRGLAEVAIFKTTVAQRRLLYNRDAIYFIVRSLVLLQIDSLNVNVVDAVDRAHRLVDALGSFGIHFNFETFL